MIIFEKDNKLILNFDNSVEEEQPDIVIEKTDGLVSILVQGQPINGGGEGAK